MTRTRIPMFVLMAVLSVGPAVDILRSAARLSSLLAPQESSFTLEGKVTEVVKDKLTVSTQDNIIFHVRVDDKTDIKRDDGSAGSAKDLHAGIRVKVAGDLEETGEIKAQKIEIEPK
ncbi:MAG TPA: DUF5666 domain-containing protein [Terriglobia bacterium]|nr:DUF5666 domain-containing protein [Terriglobia bacterium]